MPSSGGSSSSSSARALPLAVCLLMIDSFILTAINSIRHSIP